MSPSPGPSVFGTPPPPSPGMADGPPGRGSGGAQDSEILRTLQDIRRLLEGQAQDSQKEKHLPPMREQSGGPHRAAGPRPMQQAAGALGGQGAAKSSAGHAADAMEQARKVGEIVKVAAAFL